MHGFLVVDKPQGLTSHDVVAKVRQILGSKRIGHGGTLDPIATGVLVLAIGKATRLLPHAMLEPKKYEFQLCLGLQTTTQDADGEVVSTADASKVTLQDLEHALPAFRGAILQVPPMHSAVHHQGKRLYEIARQGIEVERAPRPVHVFRLEVLEFQQGPLAKARMLCECSAGTYVRTLCHDIGTNLGVGGHLAGLTRTASGAFALDRAVPLDQITPATPLIPSRDALAHLDTFTPAPAGLESLLHGNPVRPSRPPNSKHVCILDEDGVMVALAQWEAPKLHPVVVLRST